MNVNIIEGDIRKNTNIGFFTLGSNKDGKPMLIPHGFSGIDDNTHIILQDAGDIITMEISPETALERCVLFNEPNRTTDILIDYFKDFDAIEALFVRVGNTYIQCKGVKVSI